MIGLQHKISSQVMVGRYKLWQRSQNGLQVFNSECNMGDLKGDRNLCFEKLKSMNVLNIASSYPVNNDYSRSKFHLKCPHQVFVSETKIRKAKR